MSAGTEALRRTLADWSAALAAVSDLPFSVRQDVADALDLARRFNADVLRPLLQQTGQSGLAAQAGRPAAPDAPLVSDELVRTLNRWGLFTLWIPSLYGGKGWNVLSLYAFLEEVASVCPDVAHVVGAHYMGVAAVSASWNLSLADRLFTDVSRGERSGEPCLLALAQQEAWTAGQTADVDWMRQGHPAVLAVARADGGYRLQGRKVRVLNGALARWTLTLACTDPARPDDTLVMLAVRADTAGCLPDAPEAGHASGLPEAASDLVFQDCDVPAAQVAFDRQQAAGLSRAHRQLSQTLLDYISSCTHTGIAALSAGVARGALHAASEHAALTLRDGERLLEQTWVATHLADMAQRAMQARQAYVESALAIGMGGLLQMMFLRPMYWADQLMPMLVWRFMSRRILRSAVITGWFRRRFLDRQPEAWQNLTVQLAAAAKFGSSDLALANVRAALDLTGVDPLRLGGTLAMRLRDVQALRRLDTGGDWDRLQAFRRRLQSADSPAWRHKGTTG
jgi:alkylation response protein AidB-like acyl-CoA dehydrogenase